ncbi:MAG: hypothetical protein QW476_00960 [Candidatus Bathyarchaeia archaeon]|nr:hypothetical protein [Candidatus Bathyarchaeota archaeon]
MYEYEREFNEALLEAVDEALLALGESVRQAIYWYLENKYSVKKSEIPNKIGEFEEALSNMLGAAANIILKIIIKKLYAKFKLNYEEKPEWKLKNHIEGIIKQLKGF